MATRTASAIGWTLTVLVGSFLLFDGGARLVGFAPYVEGMTKFGYEASLAPWIGLALLVPTILMLIPKTAVVGLVLVTGYLGGATATHLRIHDAWFLFPVVLGALAWFGLYLREPRLLALVLLKTELSGPSPRRADSRTR
jgi:hypothetical protein